MNDEALRAQRRVHDSTHLAVGSVKLKTSEMHHGRLGGADRSRHRLAGRTAILGVSCRCRPPHC